MVSIFNYGFDAAKTAFREADVNLQSLTDYDSVIELAIEQNYVSKEDQKTLLNWRSNPSQWNVNAIN
jgi:orotate phosphoribosyltransferase